MNFGVPVVAQQNQIPLVSMRMRTQSLSSLSGSGSCCVGHRFDSHLAFLWLWCRLVAVASIRPLTWELPYAVSVALQRQKEKYDFRFERACRFRAALQDILSAYREFYDRKTHEA